MTSSPEAAPPLVLPPETAMPPALRSMWRLCKLGYQHEPRLMLVAFVLSVVAAIPDALFALWLKLLSDGVTGHDRSVIYGAMGGLAVSAAATWYLRVLSVRVQRRFRDRVTIALESHVAHLQARISTIAHHERPDYLDRLAVLRDQVFVLDHMYMSVFSTVGWILRLAITIALLMSIDPLLVLLALFAAPTVLTSGWRPAVERRASESAASYSRLARHLFVTATTAAPGKEVRVIGVGPRLATDRQRAWSTWYGMVSKARVGSAWWHSLAWLIFGLGYVGAILYVTIGLRSSAGDVLMVLAAGARLSMYIGATVGEIGFLRGIWMDGSRRLAWLEDYAASLHDPADRDAPERLVEGVRIEHLTFVYPGSSTAVLEDVDLFLPAGSVVALVGENGAGKSTLVKLLSKFYTPTAGRVLVDGVDLARIRADGWRARLSGAYQDFYRFELRASAAIGVGDLDFIEHQPALASAVDRAGAQDVVDAMPSGLDTQLGRAWPEGVDVSFGQWQKLALARGFMRPHPLLLVLDEPTAALDAETEHALFEKYAAGARRDNPANGITVLVSHRFSTARMADLIVVLDGARVVEVGSHDELMACGGQYADLYAIQAAAYR
jgi:ATP-binding cassette, subfamily B, bacterial